MLDPNGNLETNIQYKKVPKANQSCEKNKIFIPSLSTLVFMA